MRGLKSEEWEIILSGWFVFLQFH